MVVLVLLGVLLLSRLRGFERSGIEEELNSRWRGSGKDVIGAGESLAPVQNC